MKPFPPPPNKQQTKKPNLAILLAAYNGSPWIEEQINSILTQTDVNLDLFISVDLSTDDTYLICKNIEAKHSNVYILDYGKRYGMAASNFYQLISEVDFSKYDYVSLADQDDYWEPEKLSKGIQALQKNKAEGYSSDITAVWDNGRKRYLKKSYPMKKYDYYFESAGPGCVYVLSTYSFLKFKQFLSINYQSINTISGHDWLIYAYYRATSLKWFIDKKSYIKYRQHDTNAVGARIGFSAHISRLKAIRNGWYLQDHYNLTKLINEITCQSKLERTLTWYIKNSFSLRRKTSDSLVLFLFSIFGYFRKSNLNSS